MAYILGNPKTKKAAKELVKKGTASCFEPGIGDIPYNGTVYIEGPHYPQPHKWYGKVTIVNGKITKLS